MRRSTPLWIRITVLVLLLTIFVAVILTAGKLLLDIWAEANPAN